MSHTGVKTNRLTRTGIVYAVHTAFNQATNGDLEGKLYCSCMFTIYQKWSGQKVLEKTFQTRNLYTW